MARVWSNNGEKNELVEWVRAQRPVGEECVLQDKAAKAGVRCEEVVWESDRCVRERTGPMQVDAQPERLEKRSSGL